MHVRAREFYVRLSSNFLFLLFRRVHILMY